MSDRFFRACGALLPRRRAAFSRCGGSVLLGFAAFAGAPEAAFAEAPLLPLAADGDPNGDARVEPVNPSKEIGLDAPPGFALGLAAYGGLSLLMSEGQSRPHAIAGALTRLRYGYAELGALVELTERNGDQWRALGGFVGAQLPYRNWVDVEVAGGFAYRRYSNPDPRYGAGGYDVRVPSVLLRVGISDRTSESALGARFGGELVAGMDIGRREADWRYDLGSGADARVYRGSTPVGGFSIGIAMSTGFDVAFKPARRASASSSSAALSF